jgi:hypothetical protein
MLKINYKVILNSMQPKKEGRGKSFIEILSFRLSLENLCYGVLLDVKKRVNVFFKNSLDRKEETTELLCLSKRLILHATLIPASSCIWCFSTQKGFKNTLV